MPKSANQHEKDCNGQQQPPSCGSGIKSKQHNTPTSSFNIFTSETAFTKATATWKLFYNENNGVDCINLINHSVIAMKGYLENINGSIDHASLTCV